ncbi:MAG: hypothetical protein WCR42_11130 [bacterium]
MMHSNTINWLMEAESPSLKYRVMTELLDIPVTDSEVLKTQNEIFGSKEVVKILSKMHPDGYWLQLNPRTKEYIGDGVVYANFATTHFCLSYLSELGLTKENELVAKAAERYLNLQKEDGDWWMHLSCLYGYNIRTFIKLGYRNDERIQKSINLMLETNRADNGYLCDMHEKKSKKKKSCIRGAVKVLLAFSELPEYWDHHRCKALVDYFLERDGIYRSKDKSRYVNNDIGANSFPIGWQTNLWEILYGLSKMGYGKDARLNRAWDLLDSKLDADGRIKLEWTHAQSLWKIGKKDEYNEWLTFYVLLAKKYRDGHLDSAR